MNMKRNHGAFKRSSQAAIPNLPRSVSRTLVCPGPTTGPILLWGIELGLYLLLIFLFFFLQAELAASALAGSQPAGHLHRFELPGVTRFFSTPQVTHGASGVVSLGIFSTSKLSPSTSGSRP
jgi:hypothetical protein